MTWTNNFRADLYQKHHKAEHPSLWTRYQACSSEDKATFFENQTPFQSTMIPHINSGLNIMPTTLTIHSSIVDVLISDMFFHPDEHGGVTQAAVLKLFTQKENHYEVTISNPIQFKLVVAYLGNGISFRQCENIIMNTRRITGIFPFKDHLLILGMAQIGSIKDTTVSGYARIVLARNLQIMLTILNPINRSSWAFSLANDGSTHYGKSYFDNRIRFHYKGKLYNIHLIAIPMFEHHTGENMFLLVCRTLDVLCPQWRAQIIGMGSDGASSMTGHLQGVVTRLARESLNTKFYRVWCGLHQLDLVLKHAYSDLYENEVVNTMKKFIQHLRQQNSLIAEMKAQCPQLTTRWLCMGNVCKWLLMKRIDLFQHIKSAETPILSTPPNWWWIVIAGINELTDIINPTFVKLQSPTLLVSVQSSLLDELATNISVVVGIRGPFPKEEIADMDEFIIKHERWYLDYDVILEFINGLGLHVRHTLQELDDETHRKVLESIGTLAMRIVEGVVNIQAERNERNNADDDMPSTLPHELVKLSTAVFGNTIVDVHLQQLRHSWDEKTIAQLETQHKELRTAYQREPALKLALDTYANVTNKSFQDAWAIVEGRFEILMDFCGGIATIFPNTASVESDFSILGWEKDKFRLSLTDISLEGIMHCKQYEILSLFE